ncbi:MAG TPA: pirin family protein [Myxococcaceae bacterium]|nr:pirin family protein [Myxococcaceae bacterium]
MEPTTPSQPSPILATAPLGMPWRTLDPFLFCVHHDDHYPAGNASLGPAAPLGGRELGNDFQGKDGWRMYHGEVVPGFPSHPHRGFETVTIVRRGLVDHADSLGAAARYGGGDVQWLTAGRGVQHSEMFPLLERDAPNPLELFQLWLNLPSGSKSAAPHFTMFWGDRIPRHVARDEAGGETEVTVIAGALGEARPLAPPPDSWASRPDSDLAIWTLRMAPGARWVLPPARPGSNRALYVFRGPGMRIAGHDVPGGRVVQLTPDVPVPLEAGSAEVEAVLLQGRPIDEPVVQYGPFVGTSREEIQQAFADYRRTQFGGWPWPRPDPVHPHAEGRFARHADGRVERPT